MTDNSITHSKLILSSYIAMHLANSGCDWPYELIDEFSRKLPIQSTTCFTLSNATCPSIDGLNASLDDATKDLALSGQDEYYQITHDPCNNNQILTYRTLESQFGNRNYTTCCYGIVLKPMPFYQEYQYAYEEPNSQCSTNEIPFFQKEEQWVEGRPLKSALSQNILPKLHIQQSIPSQSNPTQPNSYQGLKSLQSEESEWLSLFFLYSGCCEYASIFSFEQFISELQYFQADQQLIARSQQAKRDEQHHSDSAFAIANRFSQKKYQPIPIDSIQPKTSFEEWVESLLNDAAINETLAVCLAVEQLKVCTDPQIQQHLKMIVSDEMRHAELAFETLRWASHQNPQLLHSIIQKRLQEPFQISLNRYVHSFDPKILKPFGIPPIEDLRCMYEQAIQSVVIPCLEQILKDISPSNLNGAAV